MLRSLRVAWLLGRRPWVFQLSNLMLFRIGNFLESNWDHRHLTSGSVWWIETWISKSLQLHRRWPQPYRWWIGLILERPLKMFLARESFFSFFDTRRIWCEFEDLKIMEVGVPEFWTFANWWLIKCIYIYIYFFFIQLATIFSKWQTKPATSRLSRR